MTREVRCVKTHVAECVDPPRLIKEGEIIEVPGYITELNENFVFVKTGTTKLS